MGFMMWTGASSDDANRDRRRTDGSSVSCPACSCEIPVVGTQRLPREFSVLCPNCGQRNFYQQVETHDPKQDAGAARTPAKIEFGKKSTH
jgi:hypothetical protein